MRYCLLGPDYYHSYLNISFSSRLITISGTVSPEWNLLTTGQWQDLVNKKSQLLVQIFIQFHFHHTDETLKTFITLVQVNFNLIF